MLLKLLLVVQLKSFRISLFDLVFDKVCGFLHWMWMHRLFMYLLVRAQLFYNLGRDGFFSALLLMFIFLFSIRCLECSDLCKEKDENEYYSDKYPSGPWSRYLWQVMRGYFDEEEFRESQDVKRSYIEKR